MILVGDWAPEQKKVSFPVSQSLFLANLEGPILPNNNSLIRNKKAGPNIYSQFLPDENNQFIFSLANNHIMDYGFEGLSLTINLLQEKGHRFCGAGKNIDEARLPLLINDHGSSIGIIACCEAQFGIASKYAPGVAEFGPWVYKTIKELRGLVEIIIISIHASIEDSPWPSPFLQELYKSYIDAGANIIHGHHSHIPQGFENYNNGVIFYGLGNFVVNPVKWKHNPNSLWSIGVKISPDNKKKNYELLVYEMDFDILSGSINLKEISRSNKEEYFSICNKPLQNQDNLLGLWHEVSIRLFYYYGAKYMGFNKQNFFSKICCLSLHKMKALFKSAFNIKNNDHYNYLLRYHMISCESHRQMLRTALGIISGEINDLRTQQTKNIVDSVMPWTINNKKR